MTPRDTDRTPWRETWADFRYEWQTSRSRSKPGLVLGLVMAWARVFVALLPGGRPMMNLTSDVRYGFRRLLAAPLFTLFSVVTLGLGLGAATGIYAVVHTVAFAPPTIPDVGQVVNLYHDDMGGSASRAGFSWPDYLDLRSRQSVFESIGAWTRFTNAIEHDAGAHPFHGQFVDGEFFTVLRAQPLHGRLIQPADDRESADPVVVLSAEFWSSTFAGDPSVVGQVVRIGGHPFTIVGVAHPDVRGLDSPSLRSPALWLPIRLRMRLAQPGYVAFRDETDRDNRFVRVVARLRDGRTPADALREVRHIGATLDQTVPIGTDLDERYRSTYRGSRQWHAIPVADIRINESVSRIATPVIATVLAAIALVLLVACTNLGNLLIARGAARRQELAVRLALGASRFRLMREQMVESGLVALAGGLLGVGIARVLTVVMSRDFSMGDGVQSVLSVRPALGADALGMALAGTAAAMLIVGAVPAWISTRGDVRDALATDTTGGALPRWRGRRTLIAGQVAVSMILLVVAVVSAGNAIRLGVHEPGLTLDRLAFVATDPALAGLDAEQATHAMLRARDRLASHAGIQAVAVASGLPVGSSLSHIYATAEGRSQQGLRRVVASGGYLDTIGVPLLNGRDLRDEDAAGRLPVIVLSEAAAEDVFGTADVLGRQVTFTRQIAVGEAPSPTTVATVVGIAGDVSTSPNPAEGIAYLPLGQHPERNPTLIARTDADPSVLAALLRTAVTEADRRLPITNVATGTSVIDGLTLLLRLVASMAGTLGGFALAIALVGLHGVLSFLVSRRTREIGLRLALGADSRAVRRMVVKDGLRPVLYGLAAGGAVAALMFMHPLSQVMLGTRDGGLAVAWLAPLLMLAAAAIAAYVPARRAARVDPSIALRNL